MSRGLSARVRLRGWAVLLLLAPPLAGCGGGKRTASVSGKVTSKGQAVTSGAVTFYGEDGRVDSGRIDHEGNYTVAQAPVGRVKVTVVPAQPRSAPKPRKNMPGGGRSEKHPGKPEEPAPAGKPVAVPKQYQDREQSKLTYTVTAGHQTINIQMD